MQVLIYSYTHFFYKQVAALDTLECVMVKKHEHEIFDTLSRTEIRLCFLHLNESEPEVSALCEELLITFSNLYIVVFRNNPNVFEGVSLLKRGVRGYAHALSNPRILLQIYETVQDGNVWIYPELMQFMIAGMSTQTKKIETHLTSLTSKEQEIALLVAQGLSNVKIATLLDVAEITIKKHLSTIFTKLGVKDRLSLALKVKNS